jgi:hypothetical protein
MKRVSTKEPPAAKLRDWRVAIIRKKLERLGRVAAADREAAEAAAVAEFGLTDEQRKRLLIEPVA